MTTVVQSDFDGTITEGDVGYMLLDVFAGGNWRKVLADYEAGRIPVVVCCGHWRGNGWFLQKLGNVWRWHVGGVDCDGGTPTVSEWMHIVATFDGEQARLFQNGVEVASRACGARRTPHAGPLLVGQYDTPAEQYQVFGRIADVKIFRRAVPAKETAAMFKAGRQAASK